MRQFRQNSFRQAVLIVFLADNLTKALQFLRNVVVTAYLGFSKFTDAFGFSGSINNLLSGILSDSILAGVIPFLNQKETEQEKEDFIWSLALLFLMIFIPLAILLYLFFDQVMFLVAPGFDAERRSLALNYIILLFPTLILTVFMKTIEGLFRAEKIFGVTNIGNLFTAAASFISLLLFLKLDHRWLAFSLMVNSVLGTGYYLFLFNSRPKRFDSEVFRLLLVSIPLMLGASIGVINNFVDKSFATLLPEGHLTILNYSYQMVLQAGALIIGPLAGVSYSYVSKDIADNNNDRVESLISRIQRITTSFFMFGYGVLFLMGDKILELLFLRGDVTTDSISLMYVLLLIYYTSVYCTALGALQVNIYYSKSQTVTPTIVSVSALLINIVGNLLFVRRYGAYALATTTVVSSVIYVLTNHLIIKRKYGFNTVPVLIAIPIAALTILGIVIMKVGAIQNIIPSLFVFLISLLLIYIFKLFRLKDLRERNS